MTQNSIALFGSVMMAAGLLCGAGAAKAQDYGSAHDGPGYGALPYYDRAYGDNPETVIVNPYYDQLEKQQLLGHIDGEVNPLEYTISRPVNYSDLDLSRDADYLELQTRVRDTARDLCAELDARVPGLSGDPNADRECVRTATRNAMRDVIHRFG